MTVDSSSRKAYMAEYYAANKERLAQYRKAYRETHKEQERLWQQSYRDNHPDANKTWRANNFDAEKNAKLRRAFGITLEEFRSMESSQDGVCAICGNPPTFRSLDVDHSHTTGEVRSLLCSSCNLLLGHAKDNIGILACAIEYLEKHSLLAGESE